MKGNPNGPQEELDLAAVVHDVNQMLAVISGRVGLLLSRDPRSDSRCHLEAIRLACNDVRTMIQRLDGSAEPDASSCRIQEVVAQSLALLGFREQTDGWSRPGLESPENRWTVNLGIPPDLHAGLPGQILREVLVNLLTNAVEVMPGAGALDLIGVQEGDRLELTVGDGGPGIPKELVDDLFDQGSTTKPGPGRGTGLAGVAGLLARHESGITLAGNSPQGAVFALDLPLGKPEAPGRQSTPTGGSTTGDQAAGAAVLVVDDEPSVREMLGDVLGELGCRVTCVADATEALKVFRPGLFEVALLDQTLPGLSGEDLALRLREDDPCLSVFLMTGWGNEDVLANLDAGHVDFTARKPMEFGKLRALLDEAAALNARRREGASLPTESPRDTRE